MSAALAGALHLRGYQPSSVSVLRWAGSKRQLIPRLFEYWADPNRRYVEPFAGSAGLFFSINPSKAILGDVNADLVHFLKLAKATPRRLYRIARKWPATRATYNDVRAKDPRTLSGEERAARFFYLNRFCFNGIYRTNENGFFNVPFSGSRTGSLPSWETFLTFSESLKRARIVRSDFEALLNTELHRDDFVYLDPPYAVANRRIFRQYGPDSFGLNDLKRLASAMQLIDRKGARFVLSYAYCAEALRHFGGWHQKRVYCQRNVGGFSSSRRRAAELLISNFLPQQ